jgi:UDP-N-acetylmuramyl pentapeptide phosphotransferase/UDP-N-acetylglucosamine-1-phosphate transferase
MWLEAASAVGAFVAGAVFGRWWVSYQQRRGITSRDIYKGLDGVPRAGGLIAVVAATVGYGLISPAVGAAMPLLVVSLLIGVLGLLDDLWGVNEYARVLLPVFLAFVLARAVEEVKLTIPMVGLFYGATGWLAVLAIPVMTNALNMLDPVNGFLPAANALIALALATVAFVRGQTDAVYLLFVHVAASLALYLYNRYPAKTFNGNVGSYFLGASLSTIAVLYDLVSYLILAGLPFVINGALIIFSSGGIKRREKIARPTSLKNGVVYQDCSSPIISLVRMVVADRPMGEYEIFKSLMIVVSTSSALTVVFVVFLKLFSLPV